jgi:hypothetical protein
LFDVVDALSHVPVGVPAALRDVIGMAEFMVRRLHTCR